MDDLDPTVYLVDDDAAVRDSLSQLIELAGYSVETFPSAEAFLAACGPESNGCAVVDLCMPGMGGMGMQEEMRRRGSLLPIVFLTAYGDIPTSVKAIKSGAIDFLTKPVAGSDLMPSIAAAIAAGEARKTQAERNSHATSCLACLTERERTVCGLAIEGLSNKDIGKRLGISHRTVEIHKAHVMRKTGATSLMDLARLARDANE